MNSTERSRIDRATRPERELLNSARRRAKERDLPFNLILEDIAIPKTCPVFGFVLEQNLGAVGPTSATIDKLIPKLGYVRGNIEVISHLANSMKSSATPEQLRRFCHYHLRKFKPHHGARLSKRNNGIWMITGKNSDGARTRISTGTRCRDEAQQMLDTSPLQ